MVRLVEYITESGKSPFGDWFQKLNAQAASKVYVYLMRIEQENFSNLKPIQGTFQEVRIYWGPGYRVYVGKDGKELIILLGGGTKSNQQKDIEDAKRLWAEYKRRKKE